MREIGNHKICSRLDQPCAPIPRGNSNAFHANLLHNLDGGNGVLEHKHFTRPRPELLSSPQEDSGVRFTARYVIAGENSRKAIGQPVILQHSCCPHSRCAGGDRHGNRSGIDKVQKHFEPFDGLNSIFLLSKDGFFLSRVKGTLGAGLRAQENGARSPPELRLPKRTRVPHPTLPFPHHAKAPAMHFDEPDGYRIKPRPCQRLKRSSCSPYTPGQFNWACR